MFRSRGYDPRGPGADRRYDNVPDTATRDAVADALDDARRAWSDWQDAWTGVQRAMRAAGMSTARIDAYRVGTGYDEGGGQSLEGWLDEIEDAHEAPVSEFPKQPSRKDGLGTMCTERWRAYVKGLREARKAAATTDGPEADAA
jgi:hypothetical protein